MNQYTPQERGRRLADALAIVLQHPATPAECARVFRLLVGLVAHLASIPAEAITARRPGVAEMDFITVALNFGLAVADVLDDDELNPSALNEIGECTNEIEDLLRPPNGREAEASRLRAVMIEWARIQREPFPVVAVAA